MLVVMAIVLLKHFTCDFIRNEPLNRLCLSNQIKHVEHIKGIVKMDNQSNSKVNLVVWNYSIGFIKVNCTQYAFCTQLGQIENEINFQLHIAHMVSERVRQMSIPMWLQVCEIKLKYIRWYTFDLIKQLI